MFPEWVSEIGTILVQAFMITVAGWIFVFAWQDIGGVENFKLLFRKRNSRNIQKGRYKSKQNKAYTRINIIK